MSKFRVFFLILALSGALGASEALAKQRYEPPPFLQTEPAEEVSPGQAASEPAADVPQEFDAAWLAQLREDARKAGISDAVLDEALAGITPLARVIELDRKQPESVFTFEQYLTKVLPPSRIKKAREMMQQHRALLEKIGRKYGVQPRFIVALWGMETNFGSNMGGFSIVEALATLAYDGRRSDYFRGELLKALKIIQDGHVTAEGMTGSWAGAMGQCQFMPSSFLNFAVDEDGDGKRDIWGDQADVFASIANYLAKSGWNDDETWGREVQVPAGFDSSHADIKHTKPLSEWSKLGVKKAGGGVLPHAPLQASLIYPSDRDTDKTYLVYGNYKMLLKWNRSRFFATSVSMLADAVGP